MSAFSSKGNKEQKLRFAFKVYDIDRDGFISNGELFIVLKMMVGSNLKDQQLQQIVDKTIMEADTDHDGKISFEEFKKMVENTDVSMSMTLGMWTNSTVVKSIANKWQINFKSVFTFASELVMMITIPIQNALFGAISSSDVICFRGPLPRCRLYSLAHAP